MQRLRPDVVRINDHTLRLDPLDSLLLSVNGGYESSELALFRRCINPGDVVVDVGAHIGLYTLEAARATGGGGTVHAFEPSSENYALLSSNVEGNGYRNVVLHQLAVSDRADTAHLSLSRDNTGDHTLVRQGGAGEVVTTTTLDVVFAGPVDVLKMDIQGSEPAALRGAAATLERSDLVLFLEISPSHLIDQGGVLGLLEQLGRFTIFLIEAGARLRQVDREQLLLALEASDGHVDVVCAAGPRSSAKVVGLGAVVAAR